jgi:hypothetical protein
MRACSWDNQDILSRGDFCLMRAKKLSKKAFHTISRHGVTKASRYRDAKAGAPAFCCKEHNYKMGTMTTFSTILKKKEFSPCK